MKPYPRPITTTEPFPEIPVRGHGAAVQAAGPLPSPDGNRGTVAVSHENASPSRLRPVSQKECGVTSVHVFVRTFAASPSFNNAGQAQDEDHLYHCAPGAEDVRIGWLLTNANLVTEATFELFCAARPTEAAATRVWKNRQDLARLAQNPVGMSSDGQGASGSENSIACSGSAAFSDIFALPDDFPGHLPTAERGPYRVKLTLGLVTNTPVFPNVAYTHFDVQVAGIEFAWFSGTMLPRVLPQATAQRDLKVCASLADTGDGDNLGGAVPAPGQVKKVYLDSNSFFRSNDELQDGRAYYQKYRELWGDGPNIPLLARVLLKSSTNQNVFSPNAVGHWQVLWDWTDRGAAGQDDNAGARDFVQTTMHYKPDETADAPAVEQGHGNCHVDRGGKRGPGARPVFPAQPGIAPVGVDPDDDDSLGAITAFPFKVTPNSAQGAPFTTRKWTAISETWPKGLFAGMTGVIFQPSRMAGDGYELRAAVMHDAPAEFQDHPGDVPAALQGATGSFQVWRDVLVARLLRLRLNSQADPLDVAAMAQRFVPYFVRLRGPGEVVEGRDRFYEALDAVLGGAGAPNGAPRLEDYVIKAVNPTRGDRHLLSWRPYDQWVAALVEEKGSLEAVYEWSRTVVPRNDPTGAPIPRYWTDLSGDTAPVVAPWPLAFAEVEGTVSGQVKVEFLNCQAFDVAAATAPVQESPRAPLAMDLDFPKPTLSNYGTTLTVAHKASLKAAFDAYMQDYFRAALGLNSSVAYQWGAEAARHRPIRIRLTAKVGNDRRTARLDAVKSYLGELNRKYWRDRCENEYIQTNTKYAWNFSVLDCVLDQMGDLGEGITLIQLADYTAISTAGKATYARNNGRTITPITMQDRPVPTTLDHEVGHALFLNHTWMATAPNDPLQLHQYAPPASQMCTMHYAPSQEPQARLCGFCSLRLRGWSVFKVTGPDGATLHATERTLWYDAGYNTGLRTDAPEDATVVRQRDRDRAAQEREAQRQREEQAANAARSGPPTATATQETQVTV